MRIDEQYYGETFIPISISMSPGWHNGMVSNDIRYIDERERTLIVPIRVYRDDYNEFDDAGENGNYVGIYQSIITMRFDLSTEKGRYNFAQLLHKTGISGKISRKKGWLDLDDKRANEFWKDGFFEPGSKLIMQGIVHLPCNKIRFLYMATPDEGDYIDRLDFYGRKNIEDEGKTSYQKSVCPVCEKEASCLNIDGKHWLFCKEHKVKWCIDVDTGLKIQKMISDYPEVDESDGLQ